MVSDMIITHHESAMKDRLSGKSHAVTVQLPQQKNVEQCENLEGEAQQHAERTGPHQNQTKNVSKEVCARVHGFKRCLILGLVVFQILIPVSGNCLLLVFTVLLVIRYLSKIPYLDNYQISVNLLVFPSFQPRILVLL